MVKRTSTQQDFTLSLSCFLKKKSNFGARTFSELPQNMALAKVAEFLDI